MNCKQCDYLGRGLNGYAICQVTGRTMDENELLCEVGQMRAALKRIAALCDDCEHSNADDCLNYCRDLSAVTIAVEVLG